MKIATAQRNSDYLSWPKPSKQRPGFLHRETVTSQRTFSQAALSGNLRRLVPRLASERSRGDSR